jgi:hypothetical protein
VNLSQVPAYPQQRGLALPTLQERQALMSLMRTPFIHIHFTQSLFILKNPFLSYTSQLQKEIYIQQHPCEQSGCAEHACGMDEMHYAERRAIISAPEA